MNPELEALLEASLAKIESRLFKELNHFHMELRRDISREIEYRVSAHIDSVLEMLSLQPPTITPPPIPSRPVTLHPSMLATQMGLPPALLDFPVTPTPTMMPPGVVKYGVNQVGDAITLPKLGEHSIAAQLQSEIVQAIEERMKELINQLGKKEGNDNQSSGGGVSSSTSKAPNEPTDSDNVNNADSSDTPLYHYYWGGSFDPMVYARSAADVGFK